VDDYRSSSHWLDETIACQQVCDAVSLMLDFTADKANLAAIRPALAYYVAGNVDVDVELAVAVPLSALRLLAYYRFVEERAAYSQTQWKKMSTEEQVRLLLDEIRVGLAARAALPASRRGTESARRGRDPAGQTGGANPPNGLGVVVTMRNVVTHPTRDRPNTFDAYECAEAGMHVRYWLCLALLNSISYTGQVRATSARSQRGPGRCARRRGRPDRAQFHRKCEPSTAAGPAEGSSCGDDRSAGRSACES